MSKSYTITPSTYNFGNLFLNSPIATYCCVSVKNTGTETLDLSPSGFTHFAIGWEDLLLLPGQSSIPIPLSAFTHTLGVHDEWVVVHDSAGGTPIADTQWLLQSVIVRF